MPSGNSIYRVVVRAVDGLWVYDDSKFGVREQPLVFGMDLILERMIEQVEGVEGRLNLVFSSIPFRARSFPLGLSGRRRRGSCIAGRRRNFRAGSVRRSEIISPNPRRRFICNCFRLVDYFVNHEEHEEMKFDGQSKKAIGLAGWPLHGVPSAIIEGRACESVWPSGLTMNFA